MKKLKFTLGLILFFGLITAFQTEANAMDNREIMNFNTGWLYSPMDYVNGQALLLDDSGFEAVCVPHANTVLDRHKGDDFQIQIEKYRFVSWYRRHFTLPEEYNGKRIIVEFEGVATVADVYVNGMSVGSHKGAYTGFSFDITEYIDFGADNVIAVRVDSTRRPDIPPEGGQVDYCLFGGIVRDVRLKAVNSAYISDVFLTAPDISAESGVVRSAVSVRNTTGESKTMSVETVIYDKEGSETARASSGDIQVPDGGSLTFDTQKITYPHLWSIDDPYLYTAKVSLIDNGETVDTVETKIGLRWFEFTDTGFYLNGEKLVLRGVNRHEQWPWQGRAIPDKLQIRDADLIKDTGFNAVRCSHYPQDPSFLSRCDEIGLIVFEEAPGWQHVGDSTWKEIYLTNVEEMILRDRNHPSIFTWGVRVNESWDDAELVTSANSLAKALDPTRPTHGVRRRENYDSTEMIEDIFCDNYIYPEEPRFKPFISSEHSWEHWTDGFNTPWATDAQAMENTKSFADVVNYYYGNDYCLGGFAWSMFDYDNEVNYTNTGHVFYSGMYDIFRLDKPVAHFYRSQKDVNEGIELYIANYWTETSPDTVEVYSNCDEVELLVNGRSIGKIRPNLYMNVPHPAFRFEGVAFEAGTLTAIGYIDGVEVAHAERGTPGAAAKITVTPDFTDLVADGTDMTCVTVELQDENGTRLPYAADEVTISLDGPADFIGESTVALEGGRIGFIVKSRYNQTGKVKCTVRANGAAPGVCEITVGEYTESNAVPYSYGSGTAEPLSIEDINDTDSRFAYGEGWLTTAQAGCYMNDNHYSNRAGDSLTVSFSGDRLLWYGTKAPNHGILAVSLDGEAESFIDCWTNVRQDGLLLYDTGSIGFGEHSLTVRVTGDRNALATDCYINADHIRIYRDSAALDGDEIAGGEWTPDGGSWAVNGGTHSQNDPSGDHTITVDCTADVTIRAVVPIPTANDTGYSIMGRIVDENHFYQLELKNENGGLIWAIWRCDGWDWLELANGPIDIQGETATLRLDMQGDRLSAFIRSDKGWTPLGACTDSAYAEGKIGLRTHNTAGQFTGVSVYGLKEPSGEAFELKDITIDGGKLYSVRFSSPGDSAEDKTVIAVTDNAVAARVSLDSAGNADLGGIPIGGGLKLLLWNSIEDMRPLCEPKTI